MYITFAFYSVDWAKYSHLWLRIGLMEGDFMVTTWCDYRFLRWMLDPSGWQPQVQLPRGEHSTNDNVHFKT